MKNSPIGRWLRRLMWVCLLAGVALITLAPRVSNKGSETAHAAVVREGGEARVVYPVPDPPPASDGAGSVEWVRVTYSWRLERVDGSPLASRREWSARLIVDQGAAPDAPWMTPDLRARIVDAMLADPDWSARAREALASPELVERGAARGTWPAPEAVRQDVMAAAGVLLALAGVALLFVRAFLALPSRRAPQRGPALSPCVSCGGEVPAGAETCPGCGRPA